MWLLKVLQRGGGSFVEYLVLKMNQMGRFLITMNVTHSIMWPWWSTLFAIICFEFSTFELSLYLLVLICYFSVEDWKNWTGFSKCSAISIQVSEINKWFEGIEEAGDMKNKNFNFNWTFMWKWSKFQTINLILLDFTTLATVMDKDSDWCDNSHQFTNQHELRIRSGSEEKILWNDQASFFLN